jgi:pyrimidine operon attenuation protein / uracil phosphoribosyltransferase
LNSPELIHEPLDAEALLCELAQALRSYLQAAGITRPVLVGIHSGGAWLAQRLHEMLCVDSPLASLNICFYRDDFAQNGLQNSDFASHFPVDISGRDVVLIDDILYTGRTIRAAMNELFDYGRPKRIVLACLIARDGRELPIQPDVCVRTITLAPAQVIKLRGPAPLRLEWRTRAVPDFARGADT